MRFIISGRERTYGLLILLGIGGGCLSHPALADERDALGPIPPGVMDPLHVPEPPSRRRQPAVQPRLSRPGHEAQSRPSPTVDPRAREIQYHRAEAQAHDRAGRWRSALMEYQTLMRLEPENHSHLLRAAILGTLLDQHNLADRYFTELAEAVDDLDPTYSVAWVDALLHVGEFERARPLLKDALAASPSHLRGRYYEVILDRRAGRATPAEFWRVRTLADQIRVAGWILSGETALRSWIGDDGIQSILSITLGDLRSQNLQSAYDRMRDAWTELERSDWQAALTHLQAADQLGATHPHIRLEQARCQMRMGHSEIATDGVLDTLATHSHPPELAYPAAYILIGAEQYEKAAQILQTALDAGYESDTRIQMALAYALAGSGEMDLAWPLLEPMAEQYPSEFSQWMERDVPHIRAIRADPRFSDLMQER